MEDILEEIVGEIGDESDEDEKLFSRVNKNTYVFEAKILLNDFYKILEIDDETFDSVKGESETLAGLILELKGEIPEKDEVIQFQGFTFKVIEVDQRKISRIQVILPDSNED